MAAVAVTFVLASFAEDLGRGSDLSQAPAGTLAWLAGSGLRADAAGDVARVRTQRFWLGLWPDSAAALGFARQVRAAVPLIAEAEAARVAVMSPYRSHGGINWVPSGEVTEVYPALDEAPAADDRVAVLTTVGMAGDPALDRKFHAGNRQAAISCRAAEGCELVFQGIPDDPRLDGPNLSFWRDQAAFTAWAYRTEPHRALMAYRTEAIVARGSFTRFRLLADTGA